MKTIKFCAIPLVMMLASCGSNPDEKPVAPPKEEAPKIPDVVVKQEFVGSWGRWTTARGALPDKNRLFIDIAANGRFSIDVRTPSSTGAEAISENAVGQASIQNGVIMGVTEAGSGAHDVLKRYSKWTLDTKTGKITGIQNEPVTITKG